MTGRTSRQKRSSAQLARSQQQHGDGVSTDEEGPAAGWRASDSESDGAAIFARALAGTGGEPPEMEDRPARTFQPLRPVPWRGGFSYGGGESSEDQHEDDYDDDGGGGPIALRAPHSQHEAAPAPARGWGWGGAAEAARGAPAAHSRAHASAATTTRLHRGAEDSDGPEDALSALEDGKQVAGRRSAEEGRHMSRGTRLKLLFVSRRGTGTV